MSFVRNICEFGATGDGLTLNTTSIQNAIDSCRLAGGGVVIIPRGKFVTGTLHLTADNMDLTFEDGACLVGSTELDDYQTGNDVCRYKGEINKDRCLIYGENLDNIKITGGTIDGQGNEKNFPNLLPQMPGKGVAVITYKGFFPERPMCLRLKNCRNINITNTVFRDIPDWCCHFIHCDNINIDGITIDSRINYNTDGLDLDGCQNVVVRRSRFNCGDDVIALQTSTSRPCRDILIEDCDISSDWAAFRCGPLSVGNFENLTMRNCVIHDTYGGGIKFNTNEGGIIQNILVENVRMDRVVYPVFMGIGDAHFSRVLLEQDHRGGGAICNIMIRGVSGSVTADIPASKKGPGIPECERKSGMAIVGMQNAPIKNITMKDIDFIFPGGGTESDALRKVPESISGIFPSEHYFGVLPAYGLYVRHVNDLKIENMKLHSVAPDARPMILRQDQ